MTTSPPTKDFPFTSVNVDRGETPEVKKVTWRSPSNIALVKYWGKKPVQIPTNASLSFTLTHAHTTTSVSCEARNEDAPFINFSFEGAAAPDFADRIEKYFNTLLSIMPWIAHYNWNIESENSFPHSSGIASSASSMSALALCLCDIESQITGKSDFDAAFYKKVSYIARLGSGSAARSVFPTLASWGIHEKIASSADIYASTFDEYDKVFATIHDDIVIVSKEKKSVSSSAGHKLMDHNIFAPSRYTQAAHHLSALLTAMKTGDLSAFGKIVEDEALTLHALMMCSDPSYILMEPNTLEIIKRIRRYRKETGQHIYFTLDAGPNVHILYPEFQKAEIAAFIASDIKPLAEDGRVIKDQVGQGPIKLE